MQMQEPRKKQKAGSSSERPKTEDDSSDSLAAAVKVSNNSNQLGHGVLVTKPKPPPMVTIRNDESTVEDRSPINAQRIWPLAESMLKRKLPLEGIDRNPTKFSNLKEKVREGSESQRDGIVLGEKNPLIKKRRKKVKSGIEFDITAPIFPLVNIGGAIELAHSVQKVSKKRPNITGELSDNEARRASMKLVKQKQPEKPPVV